MAKERINNSNIAWETEDDAEAEARIAAAFELLFSDPQNRSDSDPYPDEAGLDSFGGKGTIK